MLKTEDTSRQNKNFIRIFFINLGLYRLSLFLVLYLLVLLALTLPVFSNRVFLKEGEVSEWDILSPISGEIETQTDRAETEIMRNRRVQAVETVYLVDKSILDRSKANVISFFGKIRQLRNNALTAEEKKSIQGSLEYKISDSSLNILIKADNTALNLIESIILRAVEDILAEGVEDVQTLEVKQKIQDHLKGLLVGITYKNAVSEVIKAALYPNKTINQKETADFVTKNIFRLLFKPETIPTFNTYIDRSKEVY
ncbi:MAG: hypothetical protein KKA19_03455, partial [Candidatus Margulisbacteria bacterium]|nr:hypothetical protein [Candidatus Margulisiibacteriota bacterium]